ncbi:energy transducer TonB [Flocculibacter collagenilyticus]|uniref:energy transducer TonB n=1 Tax=Flocculibacter collagenilyticus TaxID=2744479 RepID=UPI0018F293F5|nr:energy transducer TonB [Flocculibacter collagenilyticus]
MVRFLLSIIIGAAVTYVLFVFMAYLISGGDKRFQEKVEDIRVEILTAPPKSAVQERRRVPPPPPPPPKQPPKPEQPEPETQDANPNAMQFNMPSVNVGGTSAGLSGPGGALGRDGDATPIVRIEPKYPIQAARDGKEGWVKLRFTINELGGVEDVEVIEAEPKRIFDREARRALKKWKYKPKIVDGKAEKQPGMTVQLEFKLNKG